MYFRNSLISRGAYFLLPLESKQEATSGWNFTKCISEVKANQLKVKNMHVKMGISTFKITIFVIMWNLGRHFMKNWYFVSNCLIIKVRIWNYFSCMWHIWLWLSAVHHISFPLIINQCPFYKCIGPISHPNFAFFTVKSLYVTQRSVSQGNTSKNSLNLMPLFLSRNYRLR